MLISIIMPFNKGIHFLKDALQSIADALSHCPADEAGYELIVIMDKVENHSPDREKAVNLIAEYREREFEALQIHTIFAEKKCTVAALRNIGIRAAKGRYLYFMDSDDYILPPALRAMTQAACQGHYAVITGPIIESSYKYETFIHDESDTGTTNVPNEEKQEFSVARNMRKFNLTILNSLIRREYMEQAGPDGCLLEFEEENEWYPDMAYTAVLYSNTDHVCFLEDMRYVKRIHNDSIQYPSLDQLENPLRKKHFQDSLDHAVQVSGKSPCIVTAVKSIRSDLTRSKRQKWLRRIANVLRRPTFLFRMTERFLFRRMSMKDNWIIFESFLGKNYSDSCKYIYEYLYENYGSDYRYIWVVNNKQTDIPGSVTKVAHLSLRWFYYTSRAKYYVNNMRQPIWLNQRKGSILLETWHGTPLKKLVFDMEDVHSATPEYKMNVYAQSRKWTYLISDNPFSTRIFEHCFLYPAERIIQTGYPRNDILYSPDRDEISTRIKKRLGIPSDKSVILYAPTWRDDEYYGPGRYQFALKLDLHQMKKQIGDDYVILLRTHYFIADAIDTSGLDDFAYNVSKYDDIAELYLISDLCITDYSSVFFDYANLKRPILFYVYDFDKYRDKLRGFYIDMETELPGPLLHTEQEVLDAITHIEDIKETFKERYEQFYDRFCCIDDGHAAERIDELIFHPHADSTNYNEQ